MILLDTHVWLWYLLGDERIRKSRMLGPINKAVKENKVFIAGISLWEVAMLAKKERISLMQATEKWLKKAVGLPGFAMQSLNVEIASDSTALPADFHGDPADRIIVATARFLGAKLFTFDKKILAYGKAGYVKVF